MSDQKQTLKAVGVLKRGGVVAFPTSTSYGLAVDPFNPKAVKKLYALKGRSFKNPVLVLVRDQREAGELVKFNAAARGIAQRFWPGPLTLVLPLKKSGPSWRLLSGGTKTLGVRLVDHALAEELSHAFGGPLTATSANATGKPNAYSIAEIKKQFGRAKLKPDFYLDGGKLSKTKSSTIVQIDGRHVTLLREGPIEFHHLIKILK
jgi:L-threonylcarbamoyladenylate synthase